MAPPRPAPPTPAILTQPQPHVQFTVLSALPLFSLGHVAAAAGSTPETLDALIRQHRADLDEELLAMLYERIEVAKEYEEVRSIRPPPCLDCTCRVSDETGQRCMNT